MESLIQVSAPLFQLFSIHSPNEGHLWGLGVFLFIAAASFFQLRSEKQEQKQEIPSEKPAEVVAVKEVKPEKSWAERITQGLSKSRNDIWRKVENLVVGKKLNNQMIEELEEILYSADLGPKVTQELLAKLEEEVKSKELGLEDLKHLLKSFLTDQMKAVDLSLDQSLFQYSSHNKKPYVIMIAGVNGAGKTTTIGKLATRLTRQGAKVVVGACDTFRAAAVDQLAVWCERAGATMIRAKEGSAPSGVGYQALEKAIAEGADYCLLDTAGRLHTSGDLMEELAKSKRVLSKLMPEAPQQVLLVLDAIAGQNSIRQAHEFNKALQLTGLIFTKCDGSSKAGSAVGIVKELSLPISYIGVGEGVDDLDRFDQELYLNSLLGL